DALYKSMQTGGANAPTGDRTTDLQNKITLLQQFVDSHAGTQVAANARISIAYTLKALGKTDDALALLDSIAADNQGLSSGLSALTAKANIYKGNKQYNEALTTLDKAIADYANTD